MTVEDNTSLVIPDYNKTDDDILCTGMVNKSALPDEKMIRKSIQEVLANRGRLFKAWLA